MAYTPTQTEDQIEVLGHPNGAKRRKTNNQASLKQSHTLKSASKKRNLQDLFYSIRYNMYNNPTVNGLPEISFNKANIKQQGMRP